MLLTLLEYTGVALVVLLAVYLLCRRFPVCGEGLGFLCILIARPLVTLQWFVEAAAVWCAAASQASLNYPPGVTSEAWYGVYVIARVLLFDVCSIILTGDLYNTLQSTPLLFGGAGAVDLPGSFAIPSALLFVMTGAIYGMTALEAANITPYGSHLFPKMTDKVKKWLGISCLVGFLLSMIFTVAFWAFRGYYLFSPDDATVWAIPILALVGLLLTGASVLALWGLVVGVTGVFTVLFWLGSCGFNAIASVVSLIPSLLDVVALHLTHGERTVYEQYLPGAPYQVPNTWFSKRYNGSPDEEQKVLTPSMQSFQTKQSGAAILPPAQERENEVISMAEKLVCITFDDGFGSQMMSPTRAAIERLAVRSLIRSSGHVRFLNPMIVSPGLGIDVSPRQRTTGLRKQFAVMAENSIQVHAPVSNIPALHLHFLDCSHGDAAGAMLEPIHRRLPAVSQFVITACADADFTQGAVQDFFKAIEQIPNTTILCVDPTSDFAKQQGYPKLCLYIADAVVKLLISPTHSSFNLSAIELVERFGKVSRVMKLSFAVASVAPGKTPVRAAWLKPFTTKAVSGSYTDALAQARLLTTEVATAPFVSSYLLFSCPFRDSRFHQFIAENNQAATEAFPGILTGAVAASGISPLRPMSTTPFFVSVAAFRPVMVHDTAPGKSEETPKKEKHAASAALPSDTVLLDVPASPPDTFVVNGNTSGKNGRGRPNKKEK